MREDCCEGGRRRRRLGGRRGVVITNGKDQMDGEVETDKEKGE